MIILHNKNTRHSTRYKNKHYNNNKKKRKEKRYLCSRSVLRYQIPPHQCSHRFRCFVILFIFLLLLSFCRFVCYIVNDLTTCIRNCQLHIFNLVWGTNEMDQMPHIRHKSRTCCERVCDRGVCVIFDAEQKFIACKIRIKFNLLI